MLRILFTILFCFLIHKCTASKCAENWYKFKNKCYFVNNTRVLRQENWDNCQRLGATMVSIHSRNENKFIQNLLDKDAWYFSGGRKANVGSHIAVWDDSSPFSWSASFASAQPIWNAKQNILVLGDNGLWMYMSDYNNKQLCQKLLYNVVIENTTDVTDEFEEISQYAPFDRYTTYDLLNKI
ncbi:C-type lectin domain family 4 member A-like protein [Leptotrombidium deliense]|uniref:C-type lectin domain family 4 member A-like protein n=1 Tax=Leptotrombidium deliense TaxID=299467 RepID=A0A443RSA8_9ACAR|nr:C-type lectin domain family 4 member A-like protein [Leptotrombidium deliense]